MSSPIPSVQGPTADDAFERAALRSKHDVRGLADSEDGVGVHRQVGGVFGFTYAVGRPDMPLFVQRRSRSYEVHKLVDGTVLIVGYLTPDEAMKLEGPGERCSMHLFPDPTESASRLVGVPVDRVIKYKEYSERTGRGLELEIELVA
jgi:hypothetical protein